MSATRSLTVVLGSTARAPAVVVVLMEEATASVYDQDPGVANGRRHGRNERLTLGHTLARRRYRYWCIC